MRTPLEQFKIERILERNYNTLMDITVTNSTIYTIIGIIILTIVMRRKEKGRIEGLKEKIYRYIEEIIRGMMENREYIPIIIGVYTMVTIWNIVGVIPYAYTVTAQIIVTITMSLTIMIGVTIRGIRKHKKEFVKIFKPAGIEKMKIIKPLIIGIEVISYLIRIISLAVRLTANVMSGHTMIKIIGSYGLKYTAKIPVLMILPVLGLTGIYLLEIGVGLIQGYVFALLTATYIKDVEKLGH